MCKLMTFTNLKKIDLVTLDRLTKSVAKNMASERNGFGITLCSIDGKLAARKFLKPSQATVRGIFSEAPFLKKSVQQVGTIAEKNRSVIYHGRTSTNDVSLENTHPIIKHGLWLSHNGVVEDSGPEYAMQSTNDTEHIVERLGTGGIKAVEKYISGYYATMSYDEKKPGEILIIKDSIASLYLARIDSIDSLVIATTESLIVAVCKELNMMHDEIQEIEDNVMFRIVDDNVFSTEKINPRGRSSYADSLAEKSLGKKISTATHPSWLYNDNGNHWKENNNNNDEPIFNFFEALDGADSTWCFFDHDRELTIREFFELSDEEQLNCTVIRSDGTICSPDPDEDGKLFDGGPFYAIK